MKIQNWFLSAALAATLSVGVTQAFAQQNGGGGGGGGRGNFDPAQFRQRIMERVKETLEVTNDEEWKVIEPLVQKVMDARMSNMGGMGRGMFGGGRRGGDNQGGDQGQQRRFGPPPSPEAETLQKAIDAKASKAEVKAALDKYVAARKAKQAELEKAQDDLRKVLTARQEAIATVNGYL
jgi:spore coat protein CotH